MNRIVIGGLAAILAAGGGGAWWIMSRQAAPLVAEAAASTPTEEIAEPGEKIAPEADASAQDSTPLVAESAPVISAALASQTISIERGACFGPCPMYKATVYGDDRLVFEGRKFIASEGMHEKKRADGLFNRLLDVAKRHNFASMDTKWPDEKGLNCPEPPTDLPTVTIIYATADISHGVTYYEGCGGTPAAERVEAMVADMDKALALGDMVGSREDWYGKRSAPDK
ncbi:MAG: DUF6438 domain-containing protein [Parvularculaceae bacterium]